MSRIRALRNSERNSDRHRPDPRPNETSDGGAAAARACLMTETSHLREQYRQAFEGMQQEQEAMRQAAEEAGGIAEAMRVASRATMAATTRSLGMSLAPMQFLDNSKGTRRQLSEHRARWDQEWSAYCERWH